jgi:hypothetical protein
MNDQENQETQDSGQALAELQQEAPATSEEAAVDQHVHGSEENAPEIQASSQSGEEPQASEAPGPEPEPEPAAASRTGLPTKPNC